jgi:hypothetical protein
MKKREPNLQNIPIKSEAGRRIAQSFAVPYDLSPKLPADMDINPEEARKKLDLWHKMFPSIKDFFRK